MFSAHSSGASESRRARLIAFYLPQYHPIPENDEWWGRGFTEWTNVARAKPLFRGHYQPHIPADLGFYDLRVPETRAAQAELARAYGIEAFCYYHYWFAGRRLLERPLNEVVKSGEPDFPFCICWANESWRGVWHGKPGTTLVEQTYPGKEDHVAHFRALLPALLDARYVRVDGKPLIVIYRPEQIPEVERFLELWREEASKEGMNGLHFVGMRFNPLARDPRTFGFDACHTTTLGPLCSNWFPWTQPFRKIKASCLKKLGMPTIYRYRDVYLDIVHSEAPYEEHYPCVIPNWDNTPRAGRRGLVLYESRPELFRQQLRKAIASRGSVEAERRIIFVKSWNEWAEGNYIEPDERFGHSYLEVIREEVRHSVTSKPLVNDAC